MGVHECSSMSYESNVDGVGEIVGTLLWVVFLFLLQKINTALNPFITVVDPPMCTDGFLYICQYFPNVSLIFSMSKVYKYLF